MASNSAHEAPRRTRVFIVGGGPCGLSMAILLQRFGIDFVLVERNAATTDHPKARGAFSRTMEIWRQWGVDEAIRARGLPDRSDVFAIVESIAGHEYGRTNPERDEGHTPSWKSIVSQDVVEEVLLAHARRSAVGQVLYGTEFLSFTAAAGHVEVAARNLSSGETQRWQADYLIGADGAGSSVRRMLDIEMRGPSAMGVMANEYWQADLSALRGTDRTGGYRCFSRDLQPNEPLGGVLNTNGRDRWLSLVPVGIDRDERPLPRTDDEVVRLARRNVGLPDLEVKVINRSIWRLSRQVASTFRKGRCFLVGDAAHRFPPHGGYGMNSGIQDAHNLAWKIAFVLNGLSAPRLLDSYDIERRPVAESNADFSFGNLMRYREMDKALRSGDVDRINFWIRDSENHIHSIGQSLGFSYDEGAVIPDGTGKPVLQPRHYEPSDRPGGRFPHFWLDLSRRTSSLDWFDRDMTLVIGPKGEDWMEAARAASGKVAVPLQVRQLDAPHDECGLQLGMRGAVLVRPDGHVAWRMPWLPPDPSTELEAALRQLLL